MRVVVVALVTAITVVVVAPLVSAADSPGIPDKALEALKFFVGEWEGDGSEDGEKIEGEEDVRSWAPGQYCITMRGSAIENGVRVQYSGICGWNADGEQLVEHWYSSDGLYVAIRYPLSTMKRKVWKGTVKLTSPEGKSFDGTCQIKKTEDGFAWTCQWEEDGKKIIRESVSRRVK